MRAFTLHDALGDQTRSIGLLESPRQAQAKIAGLPDGEYTVRDCLGGLRLRLRKVGAEVTVVERTPTGR